MTDTNLQFFLDACRENTGKHFLDSGGESGRSWQQPPIQPDCNPVVLHTYENEIDYAVMETAHFLNDHLEVDTVLQNAWEKWDAAHGEDLSWFESGAKFAELCGFTQEARDNVYNQENDLSQVYVWEVYAKGEPDCSDWVYSDDARICVVYVHAGADVRGGYGRPLFCRSKGDYSTPMDVTAQYGITDHHLADDYKAQELSEHWQNGYSSFPTGQVRDDVERVFEYTKQQDSVIVKLKTGEVVRIVAAMPWCS